MRSCYVAGAQAGLEFLCSSSPLTLASQTAGNTGVNYCAQLAELIFNNSLSKMHLEKKSITKRYCST
jgi:hypothetical protein